MTYKDKDKQREANREAKARQRAKIVSIEGITLSRGMGTEQIQGMTPVQDVIPKTDIPVIPCDTPKVIPKEVFPKATRFPTHKRGKDIKTFADLPTDVKMAINMLSDTNEEKQKRTKAAIQYQHIFPDR